MNITENIFSAVSGIAGNKLRSLLTMFGIIVGISSVIMITSVGEGYKEAIKEQFAAAGLDRINLSVSYEGDNKIEDADMLRLSDGELLRKMPGVLAAGVSAGMGVGSAVENLSGDMMYTEFTGADEFLLQINNRKLSAGRFFAEPDIDSAVAVAIIDEDVAKAIFGRADVLGEELIVDLWGQGLSLTIVGLLESDSQSQMYAMYNYARIIVPITYFQNVFGTDTVNRITIKAAEQSAVNELAQNVIRIMEIKHDNADKYSASTVSDQLEEIDSVIGLFTMFMGVVAGISLLVGGIGVMNIMLVSVTERTREIGIRKSLGATNGNISLQFLVEAIIITAIGGVLGIIFGYLGGVGISSLATILMGEEVRPYMSAATVAIAVTVSAAIGIVFGVYPAMKASRLDPIEALRYE